MHTNVKKVLPDIEIVSWLNLKYKGIPLNRAIRAEVTGVSPFCKVCGAPTKSDGKLTCSINCRVLLMQPTAAARNEKRKQTCIERYGVSSPAKLPEVVKKRINTTIERYGAKVSLRTREEASKRSKNLNEQGRETLRKKYGVNNAGQLPLHKEKCRESMLLKYGVDTYFKSEEFFKKQKEHALATYSSYCVPSIMILDICLPPNEKVNKFVNPNLLISFRCLTCCGIGTLPSETFKWRLKNLATCCTACANLTSKSAKESAIAKFIQTRGFEIESNVRILNGKEIDIFVPSLQTGVEFNGLYWHNDNRLSPTAHASKTKIAAELGIQLIHVFEDDWDHAPEVVSSRLLHRLNKTQVRIHARKCEVMVISNSEANAFLTQNFLGHVQLKSLEINVGLFFNGMLCSVMSFCRQNGESVWRLTAFCTLLNFFVAGGLSKLFSAFRKTFHPSRVICFCDNAWPSSVLKNLSFVKVGESNPTYWKINLKEGKRFRSCKSGEFLKIWDCGYSKWMWRK